jgi:hypothetical protein
MLVLSGDTTGIRPLIGMLTDPYRYEDAMPLATRQAGESAVRRWTERWSRQGR